MLVTTAKSELDGLRVLVVEDDLLIAMAIEDILAGFGCQVVGPYGRLDEAMAAAEDDLDGAIVDLNLRDEHSFPLIDRLRERSVPVIVCSGYVDVPNLKERLDSVPMLAKPCRPEKLLALMQEHFHLGRGSVSRSRTESCTERP